MKANLSFVGGFVLNVDDDIDPDVLYDKIQAIQDEANAALGIVADKFGIGYMPVELSMDD